MKVRARPKRWKTKIRADSLPVGKANQPRIRIPKMTEAGFHLPEVRRPVSKAAKGDLKNPPGPKAMTGRPRNSSMRVARRQLMPPETGPSMRPAKGEKTQPKVRKD
jgi:hypothetical protein